MSNFLRKVILRFYSYYLLVQKVIKNTVLKYLSYIAQFSFFQIKTNGLKEIITLNRRNISNIEYFINIEDYKNSNDYYGLPKNILKKIDRPINNFPTYSDLISKLFQLLKKNVENINYIEIGVSVLKNFYTIAMISQSNNLFAFDINDINQTISKKFKLVNKTNKIQNFTFNENKITYFKGDVFYKNDLENFKTMFKKANFIFSDAHHSYNGLISEYENLINNSLDTYFILYYDDLKGELLKAFLEISNKLSHKYNLTTLTFLINGWVGSNEKMHRNGIISNLDVKNFLNENDINLLNLKYY